MAISDTDKLLVNDGSKTETITFSQFKDGTVLNDSDQFLINDGTKTETITWAEIEDELGPKGVVNTPTVLKPDDGAGSGDLTYAKTDKITKVEGGGISTCETESIESVGVTNYTSTISITPGSTADSPLGTIFDASQEAAQRIRPNNSWYEFSAFGQVASSVSITTSRNMDVSINGVVVGQITDNTVNNTTSKEYTFNFTEQAVNTIRLTNTDSGQAFQFKLPKLDGKRLVNNNKILTFPENTGFGCFEPGDVVQGSSVTYDNELTSGNWVSSQFVDGKGVEGEEILTAAPGNAVLGVHNTTWYFSPPITVNSGIKIVGNNVNPNAVADRSTISFNGGAAVSVNDCGPGTGLGIGVSALHAFTGNLQSITLSGGHGQNYYSGFRVDNASTNFDLSDNVKIISKTDKEPWEIVVDGGNWIGTDGSGTAGGDTELVKEIPYDTTLTVDGPTDLADMTGSVFMSDGEPAGGKYSLTGYKLVTTDIESVGSISYSSQPTSGTPYDNTLTWASAFSSPLDVNGAAATLDDTFYSIDLSAFPIAVQKGNTVKVYCLSSAGATDDNIQINENLLSSYNPILTDDQWGGASTFAYTFTASQDITVIGCAVKGPMRFCGLELNGQLVYDGQITLTFPGDVSTNPDLQYFKAGDVVQGFDEEPLTSYILWNSIDETMMDRLSDSPTDDTGSQESLWKPNVSFNSFINGDKVWSGSPETINPGDAPSAHNPRHANFYDMGKPVNHLEWARPVGDISSSFSVYATNDPDDVNSWVKVRHNSMIYQATNANGIRSGNTDYRYYCFHIDATWNSASYVLLPDSYASDVKFKVISNGYDLDPKQNTLFVDGGEWEALGNEIWSDRLTTTYNGGNMLIASDKAFNGTFADYAHGGVGTGVVMTFDGTGITVNTSLRVNIVTGNQTNPPTVSANDGTEYPYPQKDGASVGANSGEWVDLNFTGDLSKIEFKTQGTQNGLYLYGIEIDGILLIDSTGGATKVEYETLGGQGDIISVNTDNKTLLIKDLNSNTRDNRWIAENKAGTEFYVAGPEKVDRPLLTTNVWLESSAFSTTPATDADGAPLDALKTITWSIKPDGGDEMIQTAGPSGTSNPYQPTGLTLNTWHTIKVKHEGLLLGESEGPWSTSTRFQTGASRSLKEHYVTQIRELEQQLAAAQGTKTRSVDDGKRKRARNADGTYKGDDPETPDINEAWED